MIHLALEIEMGVTVFHKELSFKVIGAAIAVHRALGPGLLESTYRRCLLRELDLAGLTARHEVPIPIIYKGMELDCGYRADIIVEDSILLELKSVERILPIHEAQLITYLKLSRMNVGYVLNFNSPTLRDGTRRLLNVQTSNR